MNVQGTKMFWPLLMVIFTILALQLLLWKPALAESCIAAPYQIPGHALVNHVVQSFQGTISAANCLHKCSGNSSCHSINWYSDTGLCQINRGSHLSYPVGLVPHSSGQYVLYSGNPMVTCDNRYCDLGSFCLMERNGVDYRCHGCDAPLGMQDGRIKEAQLNASSKFNNWSVPTYGRLNSTLQFGCWAALTADAGEFLQIDLIDLYVITRVATQGRYNGNDQWVTKYYLVYGLNGAKWDSYMYGGNVKEFQGNRDRNSVVTNTLPVPMVTRFIRFVALESYGHISMRVEVYGCRYHK